MVKGNTTGLEHKESNPDLGMEKGEVVHDEHVDTPEWRALEKKLVRKLDMTLLPVVWILYLFNYLDRNNIAYVVYLNRAHISYCYVLTQIVLGKPS